MAVFISCAWEHGAAPLRAAQLSDDLRANGVSTVFDEPRVLGDADEELQSDIDSCDLVLVLLSREFVRQLQSPATESIPGARVGWCRREWTYARQTKDAGGILLGALEPEMFAPNMAATLRALAGSRGEDAVLDLSTDAGVDAVLAAHEARMRELASGGGVRARNAGSFVEGPVDWDETERTLFYPSGERKYVGSVLWSQMHGQGVYFFQNGDRYEGAFEEDYFCGRGTVFSADGSRFEGTFRFDKRNGLGRALRADGSLRFEGEYSHGMRSGRGTEFDALGERAFDGVWREGELLAITRDYRESGVGEDGDGEDAGASNSQRAETDGEARSGKSPRGTAASSGTDMSLGSRGSMASGGGGGAAMRAPPPRRTSLMHRAAQRLSSAARKSLGRNRRASSGGDLTEAKAAAETGAEDGAAATSEDDAATDSEDSSVDDEGARQGQQRRRKDSSGKKRGTRKVRYGKFRVEA